MVKREFYIQLLDIVWVYLGILQGFYSLWTSRFGYISNTIAQTSWISNPTMGIWHKNWHRNEQWDENRYGVCGGTKTQSCGKSSCYGTTFHTCLIMLSYFSRLRYLLWCNDVIWDINREKVQSRLHKTFPIIQ